MVDRRWGEKGNHLATFLSLTLYKQLVDHPSATDAEALSVLSALRNRMGLIQLSQVLSTPLGDALFDEMKRFLSEVTLDSTTITEFLDAYVKMFSEFSGEEMHSNRALRGLIGFVQKYFPEAVEAMKKEKAPQGRIVQI